jgi:hypothetical protein
MMETRTMSGAICLSISSDFPTIEYSRKEKPVMFPPGWAMLAMNPWATGSLTTAKTIGIDVVARWSAATFGVPFRPARMPRIAVDSTGRSVAGVLELLKTTIAHKIADHLIRIWRLQESIRR